MSLKIFKWRGQVITNNKTNTHLHDANHPPLLDNPPWSLSRMIPSIEMKVDTQFSGLN